jgi:hydroxypyruvate reductase
VTDPLSDPARAGAHRRLRARAQRIWQAARAAADPAAAVRRALDRRPFAPAGDWQLLAVGKAAVAMAFAALERVPGSPERGLVVTEASQASAVASRLAARGRRQVEQLEVLTGGHPLPDRGSERAARAAEELVSGARMPLLVLLSGGGSALLTAPAPGLTLEDEIETTALLQAAGADIGELNCVRRHLARTKGGGLGRQAAGREVRVLVLSDVLGDAFEDVASGPFYGDPSSFADALGVCRRRGVEARLPVAVQRRLAAGARGELAENPTPDRLASIEHELVGSLARSVEAAAGVARDLGCEVVRLAGWITGEARVAGAALAELAMAELAIAELAAGELAIAELAIGARRLDREQHGDRARAWVGGGETVVTVRGDGVGGRAQELALGFAAAAEGRLAAPWALLSAGTDGRDGPGEAAGALVDGETLERARRLGHAVDEILERNDASRLLRATGDLLVTGPSGTNVGDVAVLLVGGER